MKKIKMKGYGTVELMVHLLIISFILFGFVMFYINNYSNQEELNIEQSNNKSEVINKKVNIGNPIIKKEDKDNSITIERF